MHRGGAVLNLTNGLVAAMEVDLLRTLVNVYLDGADASDFFTLASGVVIAAELISPIINSPQVSSSATVQTASLRGLGDRELVSHVTGAPLIIEILPKFRRAAIILLIVVAARGTNLTGDIVGSIGITVPLTNTGLPVRVPGLPIRKLELTSASLASRRIAIETFIVLKLPTVRNELRAEAGIVAGSSETELVATLNWNADFRQAFDNVFVAMLVEAVRVLGANVLEVHRDAIGRAGDSAQHGMIEAKALLALLTDHSVMVANKFWQRVA